MIAWEKIDNKIFENLAFDYMSSNYPNITWEKTKLTNDGNKDGESIISSLPLNTTIKYWYEAKYSININKSISKSHLDSTLVSSLLDGHVVVIAFITNAYISEDYKRRADIFARKRDNLKIYYINGEEIENWLAENPTIEDRYFHAINAQKCYIEDKIETVCFMDKYDYGDNNFLKLSALELRKEYLLYIRFNSSEKQRVELIFDKAISQISDYINENMNITSWLVEKGNNSLFIPVKLIESKPDYTIEIRGYSGIKKYVINDLKILDLYTPQLFIKSQIKILNDIHLFITSNVSDNLLFLVVGDAGCGKTYLLNQIRNNTSSLFSSVLLNFSGNTEKDYLLCYKLFIFCQFGSLWELKIEDFQFLNLNAVVKDVLKEINAGITSRITCDKIVAYCKENTIDNKSANFLQQHIYIDDIHKGNSEVLELFHTIIAWVHKQNLSKKIFLFTRPIFSKNEQLAYFLKVNACFYNKIQKPSVDDITVSIEKNIGNFPVLNSLIQGLSINITALYLYDLLCELKEKINSFNNQDLLESSLKFKDIIDKLSLVQNNLIANKLLSNYYSNTVFNFVYTLESGVNIFALIEFLGEEIYDDISMLCNKNIIKEISGKLYPFHDIYLEEFRLKKKNIYRDKIGEFILFCQTKGYIVESECYYQLISLGGKYFWKYRAICAKFRDDLHDNANYFAAEKIAKTIQKENQKDLKDYDYSDIKNIFVLGNCYKYTNSYELANEEFDKIINVYKYSALELSNDILIETFSEKINNNIWMLNINDADTDLKKLFKFCNADNLQLETKAYKYGYLNYYNRRMFCNFMQGCGTEEDYNVALLKSKELGLIEYEGFAHMDYARSIYNKDMCKALDCLIIAKKVFERNNEPRRLLDCISEIAYINALLKKDYSESSLLNICKIMKEQNYIQSYTRTCLKLVIIMLLSQNYTCTELLDVLNKMLMKNTTMSSGRRHQAIAYHVLAAIYYLDNNLIQSKKYSEKCLQLFSELGKDYKQIQSHNAAIKGRGNFILASENLSGTPCDFILDLRIW